MKLNGFILTSEQVEATLKKVIFGTSHLKIMSIQYAGTEKAGEQVISLATAIMENLHLSFNYMPNVKKLLPTIPLPHTSPTSNVLLCGVYDPVSPLSWLRGTPNTVKKIWRHTTDYWMQVHND